MRQHLIPFTLAAGLLAGTAQADPPRVVTDIAPLGAIVARVMAGVAEPEVLVAPGASPHDYAMRPSQARALATADIVVWVGPALSGFLTGPLEALAGDSETLTAMDGPLRLLPFREGDGFGAHDHDHDHGHDHGQDHGQDHGAQAGGKDPHLWLDPANGVAIAAMVTDAVSRADPENESLYRANLGAFESEIKALTAELTQTLAPVADRRFIVLHDAFHYFEDAFGVEAAGAVMDAEAAAPGAARLSDLRADLQAAPVVCAFAEPQVNTALLATVLEGQGTRLATLDPMGPADVPLAQRYPALLRGLALAMAACLTPE